MTETRTQEQADALARVLGDSQTVRDQQHARNHDALPAGMVMAPYNLKCARCDRLGRPKAAL